METLEKDRVEITYVKPGRIGLSKTNPRKTIREESIAEMAASIAEHGILQPLIVREVVSDDLKNVSPYELVAGERRWRGAKLAVKNGAAVGEIPVIVRNLSEQEVMEIQVIENLQREDVTAYEEAVGYQQILGLVDEAGKPFYTTESLAAKLGKSGEYVRRRLKVASAPKALLAALEKGEVGTRVCELVGRIPHAKDRDACAARVLKPRYGTGPMKVEEVVELIRSDFMIVLHDAPFDRADVELVKSAGACGPCDFRAANDKSLADDLKVSEGKGKGSKGGVDPNLCFNPQCFRAKCDAAWERMASDGSRQVMPEAEAKKEFEYGNLGWNSKYVLKSDKPGYAEAGHYDSSKLKAWHFYAKAAGVEPVLARNPETREILELYEKKPVMAGYSKVARMTKKESPFEKPTSSAAAKVDHSEKEKLQNGVAKGLLDRVSAALEGKLKREFWLLYLEWRVEDNYDGNELLLSWMGLSPAKEPEGESEEGTGYFDAEAAAISREISDAKRYPESALQTMVFMVLLSEALSFREAGSSHRLKALSAVMGVDLPAMISEVQATVLADAAAERKRKKEAAAKKKQAAPKKKVSAKKVAKKKVPAKKAAAKKVAAKGGKS